MKKYIIVAILSFIALKGQGQTSKADLKDLPKANRKILKYVEKNMGKKLGDGECPRLVTYACSYASAGLNDADTLSFWKDEILPGDVLHMYLFCTF